jgi:hypothetical protein
MPERTRPDDPPALIRKKENKPKLTTSIHIPPQTLDLLKNAAFRESQKTGQRFSVSAFLTEFIEKHRGELE